MKEIIDKHRIEIWKKALSILDDMGYICIAIRQSTKEICGEKVENLYNIELSEFIEQCFPELYKYKDKYTYGKSEQEICYHGWFGGASYLARRKKKDLMKKIIKELKHNK